MGAKLHGGCKIAKAKIRCNNRTQRAALQVAGSPPQGAAQLAPRALEVYLDNFTGAGGLNQTPLPTTFPLIAFDPAAMQALGLNPAPPGSQVLAYAAIVAGGVRRGGL